jgi:S-adenosylmethionine synthetase
MGVRHHDRISLTICCAFIGRYLANLGAYVDAREHLAESALHLARQTTRMDVSVRVNVADNVERCQVYLTVTGTSGEAGDDGQTGRGNRANRLITPFRPMTLEAVSGKNPVTHVGKLYNVAALRLAAALFDEVSEISEAECYLVSEIGAQIDEPKLAFIRIRGTTPICRGKLRRPCAWLLNGTSKPLGIYGKTF